jgi:hypothetical protein
MFVFNQSSNRSSYAGQRPFPVLPSSSSAGVVPLLPTIPESTSSLGQTRMIQADTQAQGFGGLINQFIGAPLRTVFENTAGPSIEAATAQFEASIQRVLFQAPNLLLQGSKAAVYRLMMEPLTYCITASIASCDEGERQGANFGDAKEKLLEARDLLQGLLANSSASEQELSAGFNIGMGAIKSANVHFLGKGLGVRSSGGVDFAELESDFEENVTAFSLGVEDKESTFSREFQLCMRNLKRAAKVNLTFQLALNPELNKGKSREVPDVSADFQIEDEKKFKKAIAKKINQDVKSKSAIPRIFSRAFAKFSYLGIEFITDPLIGRISRFGYKEITDQLVSLQKKENVDQLRNQLLDGIQGLLTAFNASYGRLAKDGDPAPLPIDELILRECMKSKPLHLGLSTEEFNHLLLEKILENAIPFYPARMVVLSVLKKCDVVNQGFDLIEKAKYDEQGFAHGLNLSIVKILTTLKEKLEHPEADGGTQRISLAQKTKIKNLFKTLFVSIPLSECANQQEVRSVLDHPNVFKQGFDATINDSILLPVAESGAASIIEALGAFLQPEFMQELINDSLQSFNQTFQPQEEVSLEEKVRVQNQIKALSASVLDLAIEQGMEKVSFLNPDLESAPANGAITELRESTTRFIHEFEGFVAREDLSGLMALRKAFIRDRIKAKEEVSRNELIGPTTREEILGAYKHIAGALQIPEGSLLNLDTAKEMLTELKKQRDGVVNFPSYNLLGGEVYEFARHLVKNQAILILQQRLDGLLSLIHKPAILRYGIHQLLSRPFLLAQGGVKDLSAP